MTKYSYKYDGAILKDNELVAYANSQINARYIRDLLNKQEGTIQDLKTQLEPIQKICKKYKIPLEDLPEVLEEYITYDNEEYLEKLQNQ